MMLLKCNSLLFTFFLSWISLYQTKPSVKPDINGKWVFSSDYNGDAMELFFDADHGKFMQTVKEKDINKVIATSSSQYRQLNDSTIVVIINKVKTEYRFKFYGERMRLSFTDKKLREDVPLFVEYWYVRRH